MYLEVILFVNENSWTEYVTHDNEVCVRIVDCNAAHSQVLRKASVRISFYNVLKQNPTLQSYVL